MNKDEVKRLEELAHRGLSWDEIAEHARLMNKWDKLKQQEVVKK